MACLWGPTMDPAIPGNPVKYWAVNSGLLSIQDRVLGLLFVAVSLVGWSAGSVFLFMAFRRKIYRLVVRDVFFISLALADSVGVLFLGGVLAVTYSQGSWTLGATGCRFYTVLAPLLFSVSMWHQMGLAVQRYFAIVHLRTVIRTGRQAGCALAFIWLMPTVIMSHIAVTQEAAESGVHSLGLCVFFLDVPYGSLLVFGLVGLLVPLLLLIFCYAAIYRYNHRLANTFDQRRQATSNPKRRRSLAATESMRSISRSDWNRRRELSLARILGVLSSTNVIFCAPLTLILWLDTARTWPTSVYVICLGLKCLTMAANALIYGMLHNTLRRCLRAHFQNLCVPAIPRILSRFNSQPVEHTPADVHRQFMTSETSQTGELSPVITSLLDRNTGAILLFFPSRKSTPD